jgi:hypothetical protein
MPIRVTCTKCHARFNVSEKFAGKEGPCPKCKTKIRIPLPSEEVTISEPVQKGPTDTQGKAIIDPIIRQETNLSGLQITLLAVGIIGFFVVALVLRFMIEPAAWNTTVGWVLLSIGAIAIAVPIIFIAYSLFRDQEREGFLGNDLWKRVAVCAVVYAAAWIMLPIAEYAFGGRYETGSYILAAVAMFAAGTVAAIACFEFEWLMGSAHYGLYFGIALLGRILAGLPALPVTPSAIKSGTPRTTWLIDQSREWLPQLCDTLTGCSNFI